MKTNRLAAKLRARRLALGLALREVERLSEGQISNPYVANIESQKVKGVNPDKLRVLARVYDLNYMELLMLAGYVTRVDLKEMAL